MGIGRIDCQRRSDPDSFVIRKDDWSVKSREIAEKQVLTTRTETGTKETAVEDDQRSAASISDQQAIEMAKTGEKIEHLFGMPMDVEWATKGKEIFIVQARPITTLPEPSINTPTEWPTSGEGSMYVRVSIIEQLPDPASPLFGTLAPEQMSRSIRSMIRRVIPKLTYVDEIMGFTTINDYFYMFIQFGGGNFLRMYFDAIPIFLSVVMTQS